MKTATPQQILEWLASLPGNFRIVSERKCPTCQGWRRSETDVEITIPVCHRRAFTAHDPGCEEGELRRPVRSEAQLPSISIDSRGGLECFTAIRSAVLGGAECLPYVEFRPLVRPANQKIKLRGD